MTDFMTHLYDYVSERTPSLSGDPEYERTLQAYTEIEEEVKQKIGGDLLYRYQCAVFLQTLRLVRLLLREVS